MRFLCPVVRLLASVAKTGVAVFLLLTPALAEDTLVVTVNQARVVKVPRAARTLVIGNPTIADVTLLKQGGTMVVTGKGFGETNLIALDTNGNKVAESMVQVVDGENGGNPLVVQRGMDRQSYICAPRCQPTARLGDDPSFYSAVSGQAKLYVTQAKSEASGH
ncbi:MAG: pilus assembly protein N-terminal domain-containing protein [Methylovirgula sp.]